MTFENKIVAAVAFGLLVLAGVGALSFWNAVREDRDRAWIVHTQVVLDRIDALGRDIADAESASRGYALTGDDVYVDSQRQATADLSAALAELHRLTGDNPGQQRILGALDPLVQAKMARMDEALRVRKSGGLAAVTDLARQGAGRSLMTQIRGWLAEMTAVEQGLLQQRMAESSLTFRITKITIVSGTTLALGFLLFAGLGIHRQFAERQRAEQALRSREEQFRLMVADVTTYAILTLDPRGFITSWNAGAQRIKGYREDEIIGRHFSCFYPEDALAAGMPDEELRIAAIEGRSEEEGWRVRSDGSMFWANVAITAMRDSAGTLIGFSKVTCDLTERKRAEERVQGLNRKLEQRVKDLTVSNRELDAFTYTLAHDLRAPLRHVNGFARLLAESAEAKLNDEEARFLDNIAKASKEMGTLMDELLNFARIGRTDIRHESVDLTRLVEDVRGRLRPETQDRSLSWDVEELPPVIGDPILLRQALMNLLSNAVKFTQTRSEARIAIGGHNGDGNVTVFVRDNGAGFDMKYSNRLFEVFQRLHDAEQFDGVGVGLAIVRRIVERHGGRVWAEGRPDVGATFYFSLPNGETRA